MRSFVSEDEMKPSYILTLSDPLADLETVGGKGMSLAKMANEGLPIPGGFHITTDAYRAFIDVNDLQTKILKALKDVDAALPASLETASASISRLFTESEIPTDIASSITNAYADLNRKSEIENPKSVAVRSSATAEDLPEASFAGQQETYLNIHGIDALLEAVKKCWASLWTARAIAYRIKNNIDQNTVALAVVVQEMVNAEAAGILFTANPMNGHRDEMVINAAWGLGEAIVGGLVSPDTIVADKATGKVKKMNIAEKTVITVETENGTEEKPLNDARRSLQVMKEAQVVDLVSLARRIESFYGKPQDIEWCRTNGHIYIVQSRPITALPEPEASVPTKWKLPKGAYAVMRNNIVELMADPLSPLFETLGRAAINNSLHRIMNESFGMRGIMPPEIIIVVNHYAYNNGSVSAKSMARLMFNMGKIARMMFTGAVERWTESGRPHYHQIAADWQAKDWHSFSSVELVNSVGSLTESAIDAYGALVSGVIPAAWITEAVFTNLYNRLIRRRDEPSAPTYLLGYDSLPIRADKSLYSLAEWARQDSALADYLEHTSTAQLTMALNEDNAGPGDVPLTIWLEWRGRFHEHLQQFGHTLYDLDFVHPLPVDDPAPVLDTFKLYLHGKGVNPYVRQQESEKRREQARRQIVQRLKGWRLNLFNKYLNSAQKYAPLREDGLAEIGLVYPLIRQMLRELGNRFAQQHVILDADDIYWLTQDEVLLTAARLDAGQSVESLAGNIPQRKAEHQAALQVNPPMALPQMMIFGFDLMSLKDKRGRRNRGDVFQGVAASPGKAGGVARVLHGPEDFSQMKPGDVLVAPITTPAWTPLFAMASAIVTDVGGPLSHGSIVAREYGIPAVLGTGVATRRLHSGDLVEVDGTAGKVYIKARVSPTGGSALEWTLPNPKAVMARGSFAEFVPEPISPLFATLAVPLAWDSTERLMNNFGVTEKGSYQFAVINSYLYIGMVITPKMTLQMTKASFALIKPILKTAWKKSVAAREKFLETVERWQVRDLKTLMPSELLTGAREIFSATAEFYNMAQSATIPTSLTSEALFGIFYKALVKRKDDPQAPIFLFGSENNALRSEKALFDLTMWAKEQPELADYLIRTPADVIAVALQTDPQPDPVLKEFAARFDVYLREFGHAIYDLDFAKPVPADAPAPLIETMKVYLSGKNNPHERQRAALERSQHASEMIIKRLDPLRRNWFIKLLKWAQDTAPLREDSIADLGLGHPQIRRMLGEFGKRLVSGGAIACADDVYWLEADEVDALAISLEHGKTLKNFTADVENRKVKWEAMRHIIPPNTLPQKTWMSKFYADNEQSGATIKGLGASAGKVTARACIMLGPEDFSKMQMGDVIVAGITTPAWTPLFARASAIVTDIGGPLSHSSIVAREYGIPAVLATGVGTRRIHDGQIVTVDGGLGMVSLN
jgi:pyruvate,water dikinase